MQLRERFRRVLKFRGVDRIPNMEIGVWKQTYRQWIEYEGLPDNSIEDGEILWLGNDYFNLDGIQYLDIDAWRPYPWQEDEILDEDNRYVIYKDSVGRIRKALKEGSVDGMRICMDQFLDFPVKDRETFLKYKKGFQGNFNKRYPDNWEILKKEALNTDKPLHLMNILVEHFGYYSILRSWMGTTQLSYMFYDDPHLINECCEFLTNFIIGVLDKAVKEVQFDFVVMHEDMGFNKAPLVSPSVFKKFFFPEYKKVINFFKKNSVEIVMVDSDGNVESLIPLFLEAGLDGFHPMEVAAGMDPVKLRKKYGKKLLFMGGVNKYEIAKGKYAIKKELKRLESVIEEGGYIPFIDHEVQPGVTFENFKFYLDLKKKILGIR